MKYVISERAKIDLAEIWYYSQTKWGIRQADKYLDQFYETFDFLTRNSKLGKQTLLKITTISATDVKNIRFYYEFNETLYLLD